jgi:glyoxylase-like metal-dependent hydrolase (beta-lactamase superfamily II)
VNIEYHAGPAQGSTWVTIPALKAAFIGDAILVGQPPFLTNADIPAWVETLELLLASYRDYKIISGRGGLVSIEDVSAQHHHMKNILKGLEKLAKKNAAPEDIESLIPGLLADLSFPPELKEQYIQRYRHGLYQYYTRHYRPVDSISE